MFNLSRGFEMTCTLSKTTKIKNFQIFKFLIIKFQLLENKCHDSLNEIILKKNVKLIFCHMFDHTQSVKNK
jgi:hypothetical protein